jgi:predicted nucleic acid-binding protein
LILFYDACAVIYQVELKAPWYERLQALASRTRTADPDARIAVSALSLMECRVQPLREADTRRLRMFDEFFALQGLVIAPLDAGVLEHAAVLRAQTSLRTPDAIQAACALSLPGEVKFLTNDATFRRVSGLSVVLV